MLRKGRCRCKLRHDDGQAHWFDRVLGAIAQLVEHLHGMQGVRSSSLLGSTRLTKSLTGFFVGGLFCLPVLMHQDLAR